MATELNKFSRTLTQEVTNPAAQAMLYGIGLKEEDMAKPQIGIAVPVMREIRVICTLTDLQFM